MRSSIELGVALTGVYEVATVSLFISSDGTFAAESSLRTRDEKKKHLRNLHCLSLKLSI